MGLRVCSGRCLEYFWEGEREAGEVGFLRMLGNYLKNSLSLG